MKLITILIIALLGIVLGTVAFIGMNYNITGLELTGLIVISILSIFITVTVHSIVQSTGLTREREINRPQKL